MNKTYIPQPRRWNFLILYRENFSPDKMTFWNDAAPISIISKSCTRQKVLGRAYIPRRETLILCLRESTYICVKANENKTVQGNVSNG